MFEYINYALIFGCLTIVLLCAQPSGGSSGPDPRVRLLEDLLFAAGPILHQQLLHPPRSLVCSGLYTLEDCFGNNHGSDLHHAVGCALEDRESTWKILK